MRFLLVGFVIALLGGILVQWGYVASHRKPYAASNGRLPLGAALAGVGIVLMLFGIVVELIE